LSTSGINALPTEKMHGISAAKKTPENPTEKQSAENALLTTETQERRKNRRVWDAIAMCIDCAGQHPDKPPGPHLTHVVNLSSGGLRFNTESRLTSGEQIHVIMRLGRHKEIVSIPGNVVYSNQTNCSVKGNIFSTHVAFNHTCKNTKELVTHHIDQVLTITGAHGRSSV